MSVKMHCEDAREKIQGMKRGQIWEKSHARYLKKTYS